MTEPAFYTVAEVAEILRFPEGPAGEQRVRRLIRSQQLRAVAVGRIYRIPASAIEQLAAA